MNREIISTNNAPAAIGPYSQAIVANGLLYTSGQIPLNPETKQLVDTDITAAATQALTNLKNIIEASGSDMQHVIKVTCFLKDINDFAAFNAVYGQFFTESCPARSCFAVGALPLGAMCEVEAVALVK